MRASGRTIALLGLIVGCGVSVNACFQPELLSGSGGAGASGSTSGSGGTGGVDGGGTGGMGGMACGCPDEDPSNPCTMDQCVDGVCTHPADPMAAGAACDVDMGQVCNDKGACVECLDETVTCPSNSCPKRCDGAACKENKDCLSDTCVAGSCRLPKDEACNDPVECASNYCDPNNQCSDAPGNATLCSGKEKSGSQCLAAPGEPCGDGLDCMSKATCVSGICKGDDGATCVGNHQCTNYFCKSGTCSRCTSDADCGGVLNSCTGACPNVKFPNNAYCITNISCASNNCTGFPRLCQPPP